MKPTSLSVFLLSISLSLFKQKTASKTNLSLSLQISLSPLQISVSGVIGFLQVLKFMAFKHRKLFPTEPVINPTMKYCPPLCDLDCQYKFRCIPNPNPYLNYSPPPPPPLSYIHKDPPISPFVIIMITVLSSLFLLVSYYAIIVKHCGDCTRSNAPRSPSEGRDEEQRLDENQGPVIDHPIWFITTVGLHEAIINSITVCKYKKDEGLIEGADCSVCLSEFQEGETLRLLPKCNHAFHTHCIDTWLSTHTNCPLCRARIVSETVSSNTASAELNSQNLSANEETQMVNYEGDAELSDTQARSSGFGENRAGTEDACEQQQVYEDDNRRSKEAVNSTNENNGVFQVPRTSIDNHHQSMDDDEEIQQLRGSISMDSSSTTSICVGLEKIHSEGSSGNPKLEARESISDIVSKGSDMDTNEETLQNSPVSVKRSLSNGGGKSFWPRHNRCPNSILPL